jgi:hypothetical protein
VIDFISANEDGQQGEEVSNSSTPYSGQACVGSTVGVISVGSMVGSSVTSCLAVGSLVGIITAIVACGKSVASTCVDNCTALIVGAVCVWKLLKLQANEKIISINNGKRDFFVIFSPHQENIELILIVVIKIRTSSKTK